MAQATANLHSLSETSNVVPGAPITEPVIVATAFLTGGTIEVTDTIVRMVTWEQVPSIGDEMVERRVTARLVMSTSVAREISAALRNALARGGH